MYIFILSLSCIQSTNLSKILYNPFSHSEPSGGLKSSLGTQAWYLSPIYIKPNICVSLKRKYSFYFTILTLLSSSA